MAPRGQGEPESVQEFAEALQLAHGQPGACHDCHRASFRPCHPGGKQMCGAVGPAHKDMRGAVVLILTKNDKASSGQRMERISDRKFCDRNQGTMSPLPIAAGSAPLPCTR
jgi:hypothetical protein